MSTIDHVPLDLVAEVAFVRVVIEPIEKHVPFGLGVRDQHLGHFLFEKRRESSHGFLTFSTPSIETSADVLRKEDRPQTSCDPPGGLCSHGQHMEDERVPRDVDERV